MSIEKKYKGVVIPTVTPLNEDFSLDENAVEKMFDNFYKQSVLPFILGTTGEAASIPVKTKNAFIKKASVVKKAGTHLYVGISSNCLEESIDAAKLCGDLGADVAVATIPSYYALTESQIQQYFEQLADVSPVPVIIYNIPATTHVSLPLHIIDAVSYHPNIVGAKDSERSDERLQQSIALWKNRADFSHFVGWAARSATALMNGSDGIIPSTGNLFPKVYDDLLQAIKEKDFDKANALQDISDVLGSFYQANRTLGESLWALKVLMQQIDLCKPVVMPPLQPQLQEQKEKLIEVLTDWMKINNY
jgi:4-hydroxy-tetrahydrodipicolinate synthase